MAGGLRKDALRALVDPPVITGDDVKRLNEQGYGKFLVTTDRVIGVSINGEARAYPLLIMKVHEIANDTLGGMPIAVTYNPLCDSVAVFDRRVDGRVLEFGVSGLLYNSNLLMYDRRPDGGDESLWSQLQARAVTGPAAAAGHRLRVLDVVVAYWGDWLKEHPDTTVIERDPRMARRYKETKYETYLLSSALMFPVDPPPPADGPPAKQRMIAVTADGQTGVWATAEIARHAAASGAWHTRLGNRQLSFRTRPGTDVVTVTAIPADPPIETIYALWFAWHATRER